MLLHLSTSLWFICYMRGNPPKTQNLFVKKLCIHSYMFKLQSLSKYSLLMQYTYQDIFPLLKKVFELIDFDTF